MVIVAPNIRPFFFNEIFDYINEILKLCDILAWKKVYLLNYLRARDFTEALKKTSSLSW